MSFGCGYSVITEGGIGQGWDFRFHFHGHFMLQSFIHDTHTHTHKILKQTCLKHIKIDLKKNTTNT